MSKNDRNDLLKRIQEKNPNYKPLTNVVQMQYDRVSFILPKSVSEIQKMEKKEQTFALLPILPAPGLMMIFAQAGVGKTYFALNLAYTMAMGGSFLKYTCDLPKRVLYVDGEMSFTNLHGRLINLGKTYGELEADTQFKILTPDLIPSPYRIPSIDQPEDQQFYEQLAMDYDVIFFDNLSTLAALEENSSSDWKRIQDWLIYLRTLGKTIIVIHHSGKDKTSFRGTSRMMDVMNTAISLEKDEAAYTHPLYGEPSYTVRYQKHRDFWGEDTKSFDVFEHHDQWGYQNKELSELDQLIDIFDKKMTQRQMAVELDMPLTKVNRLIKKARSMGKIRA